MRKIDWQEISKRIAKFLHKALAAVKKIPIKKYIPHIRFSWGTLLYGVPIFFLLYYPLGAYLMEHIDTDSQIEINKDNPDKSATVAAVVYLIHKETNDHMWTPNMPIIFPGYILDNMPAFQTGEIKAAANITASLAIVMKKYIPAEYENLETAAEYLNYSPTVWFFSEKAGKIFAPSSSTQYKKAKKELKELNRDAAENKLDYIYTSQDLDSILESVYKDLSDLSEKIKEHMKEKASGFIDSQSDNLFYYGKGKIYGYYILLRALGEDYKDIIAEADISQHWASILKCLADGSNIDPLIIRNANTNSSFSPNHLAYLDMYILCALKEIKSLDFVKQEEILN